MLLAVFVASTLSLSGGTLPTAQGPLPIPEADESTIGYPSVAAAREALRAKPGVVFTKENGWDVAIDEAALTVWSFAPPSYPAFPAVVKRQAIPVGQFSRAVMSVQCEASKASCDELVRTFSEMNGLDPYK